MKLMSVCIASTKSINQQKIVSTYFMRLINFSSSPASFFDIEFSKSGGKNPKCAGSSAEILLLRISCLICSQVVCADSNLPFKFIFSVRFSNQFSTSDSKCV